MTDNNVQNKSYQVRYLTVLMSRKSKSVNVLNTSTSFVNSSTSFLSNNCHSISMVIESNSLFWNTVHHNIQNENIKFKTSQTIRHHLLTIKKSNSYAKNIQNSLRFSEINKVITIIDHWLESSRNCLNISAISCSLFTLWEKSTNYALHRLLC